jgi:hypothetical protein
LGLNDDLPLQIGEEQASTLTNWYKDRRKLKRRKGQLTLGAAALSPDQNLKLLEWLSLNDTEHLIGVHDQDVVDFFASPVGAIVPNGTNRLPGSGAADANSALVEQMLVIGNGIDPNVRYNGATEVNAAAFTTAANTNFLKSANDAGNIFSGQDLTVAAWVYLTSFSGGASFDKTAVGVWDRSTLSLRDWHIGYNLSTGRLRFAVQGGGTVTFVDETTVTVALNTWYLVVGQHNAATDQISIRVNAGAPVTAAHTAGLQEPNTPLTVGGQTLSPTTIDEQWTGRVGPIGIWRTAEGAGGVKSDAIVDSLYNSGVALRYAELSAAQLLLLDGYWDMDEPSGTRDDATTAATAHDLLQVGTVAVSTGSALSTAVARQMVQAVPTAPTLVTAVGTHHPAGIYEYRISFLNADGEYGEAGPSVSVEVFGNVDISVQSIPICPAGQDCSGRRIWRRSGGSTVYQKVVDILDNVTTVYVDEVADADLGEDLVEFNTAFPPSRYFDFWGNRLVGAFCLATAEGDTQTVFISNESEPWYCPLSPDTDDPTQGSRARLQGRAAGTITGLRTHGGVVAVFTGGAGWLLRGDQPLNFTLQRFTSAGCVAHRTIVSAKDLLIWLSVDGVYAWDGTSVTRISDEVRTTLEAMTAAEMEGAHAVLFDDRYYLYWSTGCLWFDLQYKIWGKNDNNLWRDATTSVFVSGQRARLWAAHEGHARVYQLETGATDAIPAANTPIVAVWSSRDWDCGLPAREKRVHFVESKFRKSTGTATITLYRDTGESIQTLSHNTATVNNASDGVSALRQSVVEQARSEMFRAQVSIGGTDPVMELLAIGLAYTQAD